MFLENNSYLLNENFGNLCDCGCNLSAKNEGLLFIGNYFNCKNLTLNWILNRSNLFKIQISIITKKIFNFNQKFEIFRENVVFFKIFV